MGAKLLDTQAHGRQFIDRYEVMGEIASGGMATVYLARLTGVGGFQRLYAIKRLHPHLAGEKEFVEMFLDEARLAAGIHHPHVVPILEVGASPTGYYLVMEYIEGETFARLLARAGGQKTPIPAPIVVRIGLDMLAGLHAAHELKDETGALAGLVHRDVSPQNVLVGADGVSRITDFGVARAASRLTATRVGQLKGKIAYMAPEQATGAEDVDRRADVFAAGIVIWEGLAHKRLFKAENEAATLSRVISEPIPVLATVAPQIPRAVSDVVMRALERDLGRRYASCAEFADALERAALNSGVLGSGRDLQSYLVATLGPELDEQRSALRAWAQRNEGEPSGGHHSQVSQSGSRPLVDYRESTLSRVEAPRKNDLGLKVTLLALLMVLGGGAVFVYDRYFQERRGPSVNSAVPLPVPSAVVPAPELKVSEPLPANSQAAAPPAETEPGTSAPAGEDEDRNPEAPSPGGRRKPPSATVPATAPSSPATAAPTTAPPAPTTKPKPKPPLDDLGENPYR